jgi:hypothetical protein
MTDDFGSWDSENRGTATAIFTLAPFAVCPVPRLDGQLLT